MSWTQGDTPICTRCASTPAIETIIEARKRDLGGFTVGRLLPSSARRLVGPSSSSITWARSSWHRGPGSTFARTNLATVTYLFEGEIVHRDSLGFARSKIRLLRY